MVLSLLGRRQANLCFHFAGSGENLPDIAKSRDTKYGKEAEQLPFLSHKLPFLTSAHCIRFVQFLDFGDFCSFSTVTNCIEFV